jgi:hypothetical protein
MYVEEDFIMILMGLREIWVKWRVMTVRGMCLGIASEFGRTTADVQPLTPEYFNSSIVQI